MVYLCINTVKSYVDCEITINYDKLWIVQSQIFTLFQPCVYIRSSSKVFVLLIFKFNLFKKMNRYWSFSNLWNIWTHIPNLNLKEILNLLLKKCLKLWPLTHRTVLSLDGDPLEVSSTSSSLRPMSYNFSVRNLPT